MECIRCHRDLPDNSLFCNYCGKRQTSAPEVHQRRRRRPKGSGSVYKLSGRRSRPWVAMTGEGKVLGLYEESSQAVLALDTYNADHFDVDKRKYALRQIYASFCGSPAWEKLSEAGREGLTVAWGRLEPLADQQAVTIKLTDYQNLIDTALKRPKYKVLTPAELATKSKAEKERYAALTAQPLEPLGYDGKNRIKQLVSHLYNEMIRLEITDRNLSDLLVLPGQPKSGKRNFSEAEKAVLQAHDEDDTVKIILIYIGSGLRLNELLKLPRDAVDLKKRILTGGSKTMAGRNRVVPILDSIQPYVEYFYAQNGKYLIERDGAPIRDDYFRRSMFYPKLDELGIERRQEGRNVITPHRARHTFTAAAIKAGVAPEALTEVLGHTKYSTTVEKYGDQLDTDFIKEELQKVR